jgi:hypothetical protein
VSKTKNGWINFMEKVGIITTIQKDKKNVNFSNSAGISNKLLWSRDSFPNSNISNFSFCRNWRWAYVVCYVMDNGCSNPEVKFVEELIWPLVSSWYKRLIHSWACTLVLPTCGQMGKGIIYLFPQLHFLKNSPRYQDRPECLLSSSTLVRRVCLIDTPLLKTLILTI